MKGLFKVAGLAAVLMLNVNIAFADRDGGGHDVADDHAAGKHDASEEYSATQQAAVNSESTQIQKNEQQIINNLNQMQNQSSATTAASGNNS